MFQLEITDVATSALTFGIVLSPWMTALVDPRNPRCLRGFRNPLKRTERVTLSLEVNALFVLRDIAAGA